MYFICDAHIFAPTVPPGEPQSQSQVLYILLKSYEAFLSNDLTFPLL